MGNVQGEGRRFGPSQTIPAPSSFLMTNNGLLRTMPHGLEAFEAGQRLIEFCQENALVIANTLFQQHKRRLYTWTSPDGQQ